jgi:hypothetical protein
MAALALVLFGVYCAIVGRFLPRIGTIHSAESSGSAEGKL